MQFSVGVPRDGRWIQLLTQDRYTLWVDTVSLERGGTPAPAGWLRFLYAEPQRFRPAPFVAKHQAFDARCSTRELRLGRWVTYGATGDMVAQGRGEDSLQRVVPESAGELILEQLCAGVSGSASPPRRSTSRP